MWVAVAGCQKDGASVNDPKGRLQEYISKSFAVSSIKDRNVLAGYLSGEAKKRIFAWSDDQFAEAFIDSKRSFLKMIIHEIKPSGPNETQITYEVTYIDQGRGHDAKVTSKKLCVMSKENDQWYISSVKNVKELVVYKNELSLP